MFEEKTNMNSFRSDDDNQTTSVATAPTLDAPVAPDSMPPASASAPAAPPTAAPLRRPAGRALAKAQPLSPQALLLGLRRRWRQAVIIGVPLMMLAAALAWLFLPAHYTAFALLRVASTEPRLVFHTAESESDFHTYRRTQMALVKSRFVLNAALRKPGISELSLVRQQQYPLQWLESAIVVDSYDSPEILPSR